MEQVTRIGAYGVALDGGKILLIKQKGGPFKGKYDFPGGGVEFGETPEDALKREFAEEVAMGFMASSFEANLSHVSDSFFQIGMIYRLYGVYALSQTSDFEHYWIAVNELNRENCSALLWKWVNLPKETYIDLTHKLDESIPSWDGNCGFKYPLLSDEGFHIHSIEMEAGVGTHMDAPAHIEGKTIDELALDDLIGPLVVIDGGIESFEKAYGRIPKGCFVIIRTGWDRNWHDRKKYEHDFPTVSKETAELLLARGIIGLGVDTLSPDGRDSDFPVHKTLLGAGKLIIENVANAGKLPPVGSTLFALPLIIRGGTESPMRLIAKVN